MRYVIAMENYQICKRCVMDNKSDPVITFDKDGYCSYCSNALEIGKKIYFPNEEGKRKWEEILKRIKEDGKGKQYDCLMGISGGLDSSYLAYLGYKWGLRILAVHIDDGYDTEISKSNIKKLAEATNIDLKIETPDAEQFNDLTAAYIRANVPNLAIPQDNVLFAALYKYARKYKISYFLGGGNYALECILQRGNSYTAYDVVNIKNIHKRFGTKPINKLPFLTNQRKWWDEKVLHIQSLRPLNYIDYNRERALKELHEFCGFEYYGSKHLENTLTKFIQVWWFYNRYGVDKRRSHLSSMIVSGQMTRDEALKELEKPIYDESEMKKEIQELLTKLGISESEFEEILKQAPKQHSDYKTDAYLTLKSKIKAIVHRW